MLVLLDMKIIQIYFLGNRLSHKKKIIINKKNGHFIFQTILKVKSLGKLDGFKKFVVEIFS
jgi:hypothetical protein